MSDRLLTEQDMWLYSQCSSHLSHRMSKTDNNNMIPSLGGQKCDNGEIKDAHSEHSASVRYGIMADATIGHNSRVMLKATSVALAGMSSYSRLSLLKESAAERKIR